MIRPATQTNIPALAEILSDVRYAPAAAIEDTLGDALSDVSGGSPRPGAQASGQVFEKRLQTPV